MIEFATFLALTIGCALTGEPIFNCSHMPFTQAVIQTPQETFLVPMRTGKSVDVLISADAYLVWDIDSGKILHERNATKERPIASLNKLLSVLAAKELVPPATMVEVTTEARRAQALGANVTLPLGEHVSARDLYAASLIPSANDAMVALAVAAKGSEAEFIKYADEYGKTIGLTQTKQTNSTGLSKGNQFSTAKDVQIMLSKVYADPFLKPFLTQDGGTLTTNEGSIRKYESTNKLLGTYLPILAAKTGYTIEAGENLAIITQGTNGKRLGVVVLGSTARFQDTKVLVEWIWDNYTWQ